MRLRSLLPVLLAAFALSVFVGVLAAARGSELTLALAAGLFVLQALFVLARTNAPLWRDPGSDAGSLDWAWDNTHLTAIVYAWGAAAMFSIYGLSKLHWRHWWQYGAGFVLLAAGAFLCAHLLSTRARHDRAAALVALNAVTIAQLVAVAGALVFLFGSGKLATVKQDWAANIVFVAGGVTVAVISLVSLLALRRRTPTP